MENLPSHDFVVRKCAQKFSSNVIRSYFLDCVTTTDDYVQYGQVLQSTALIPSCSPVH